jgi:crossover junction endodeoxyribonuclease RusA
MITIDLAFPPAALSPNAREHWSTKAGAAREYRFACKVDALNVRGARPAGVHTLMTITFILKDKRRRDFDNLIAAFKPGLDGLVDAGILEDDSVWKYTPTYRVELGKKPAVRIEVA